MRAAIIAVLLVSAATAAPAQSPPPAAALPAELAPLKTDLGGGYALQRIFTRRGEVYLDVAVPGGQAVTYVIAAGQAEPTLAPLANARIFYLGRRDDFDAVKRGAERVASRFANVDAAAFRSWFDAAVATLPEVDVFGRSPAKTGHDTAAAEELLEQLLGTWQVTVLTATTDGTPKESARGTVTRTRIGKLFLREDVSEELKASLPPVSFFGFDANRSTYWFFSAHGDTAAPLFLRGSWEERENGLFFPRQPDADLGDADALILRIVSPRRHVLERRARAGAAPPNATVVFQKNTP